MVGLPAPWHAETGAGRPFGPEESQDEQAIPENAGGFDLRLV
jgi:hypothetical protein